MKRGSASLAGAPLLWIAHFVAVYGLASLACALGPVLPFPPQAATAWGVAIATLAALALAIAGLLRNAGTLRRGGANDMQSFVARTNLLLYGLATVALLWVALPGLLLPACS